MLFVTVGTQFPFDRLVRAVDAACAAGLIDEPVVAQIGNSFYRPRHMNHVAEVAKNQYDDYFRQASAIIGHAGIGTISMAMRLNKPLLVMPRLAKYGEVVHDHQVDTAEKFGSAGHILVAQDELKLPQKILELRTFVPVPRTAQPEMVVARVMQFLQEQQSQKEAE